MNDFKTRVADARAASETDEPIQKINDTIKWLGTLHSDLAKVMQSESDPARLISLASQQVRADVRLAMCSQRSLKGALMNCAQLGLEPGAGDEVFLRPYFNEDRQAWEAQWILGYKGMVTLFWRSELARSLRAKVVYEGDDFQFAYADGPDPDLLHRPALTDNADERRGIKAFYAVASLTTGGWDVVVLSPADVNLIRPKPGTVGSEFWETHYEPMALKSCIRPLLKLLPKSKQISRALALDGGIRNDTSPEGIDADPDRYENTGPADSPEPGSDGTEIAP